MILPFKEIVPEIARSVFVAPSAQVIGDVKIGMDSSIWFGSVVRGDVHYIRIGERTNIQDLSVLHVTRKTHPLVIGNEVTVGHRVILHGCTVGDRVLIGMGTVVLDGALIEEGSFVGAGSLITEGMKVPSGTLALGSPARIKRELSERERAFLSESARNYVELAQSYLSMASSGH